MAFQYSYKKKNIDLQSASRKQLEAEARRLTNLTKRRIKAINKKGYQSYQLSQLLNEQENIRKRRNAIGSLSLGKRLKDEDLQDIIRSYDKFLSGRNSTPKSIEFYSKETKKNLGLDRIEKTIGRKLSIEDLAKVNYIRDNAENYSKIRDLYESSDQIITNIINSEKSAVEIINEIDNVIFGGNKELSYEDIENAFARFL